MSDVLRPAMGVEEEYFLVDPHTREPKSAAARVIARAAARVGDAVCGEFSGYQVEARTPPRTDAARLHADVVRLRTELAEAAAAEDLRICASGTPVLGGQYGAATVPDHPRYRAGIDQYRAMLDDFTVCALHVHIQVADPDVAVLVGNHLRPWLPLLVALSANSPFHRGRDTGYSSWRSVVRSRFPCLGPPPYAESADRYHEMSRAMAQLDAMLDADLPFWDIRPNPHLPTVEIRAMDVTADVDDMTALAVLVRALVTSAEARVTSGDPGPRPSAELLRAAYWRAGRDAWHARGVDPCTGEIVSVSAVAAKLFAEVRPALDEHGDADRVEAFLHRVATGGCGADRQRAALVRRHAMTDVVDDLIARTSALSVSAVTPHSA